MGKRLVDGTFVLSMFFVVSHSPILAVQLLENRRIFIVGAVAPNRSKKENGSALRNPVGAKIADKIDQVASRRMLNDAIVSSPANTNNNYR